MCLSWKQLNKKPICSVNYNFQLFHFLFALFCMWYWELTPGFAHARFRWHSTTELHVHPFLLVEASTLLFLDVVSVHSPGWPWIFSLALAGFYPVILLPQHPESLILQDCTTTLTCLFFNYFPLKFYCYDTVCRLNDSNLPSPKGILVQFCCQPWYHVHLISQIHYA